MEITRDSLMALRVNMMGQLAIGRLWSLLTSQEGSPERIVFTIHLIDHINRYFSRFSSSILEIHILIINATHAFALSFVRPMRGK